MFNINNFSAPPGKTATLLQNAPIVQSQPLLNSRMGSKGAYYTITIEGMGIITLLDVGDTVPTIGPFAVLVNESVYWGYAGEGKLNIEVDANGAVKLTNGVTDAQTILLPSPPSSPTPPPPSYTPVPGSISAESTLMQIHKAATLLPPQSSFVCLQTASGNALFFTLNEEGTFQLLRQQSGGATGWLALDFTQEIQSIFGTSMTMSCFSAVQNHETGEINITVGGTGYNNNASQWQTTLYWLSNLPNDDNADWMQPDPGGRNWVASFFGMSSARISNVLQPPQIVDPVCALKLDNGNLQNYIVNTVDIPAAWKPFLPPVSFDSIVDQCMGCATSFNGAYQLATPNGGHNLNFYPLQSWSRIAPEPYPIHMYAPDGATRLAALSTSDNEGNTNLFVAAQNGIYLYTPDQQVNDAKGTLICSNNLITGVTDFFAIQTNDTVVLCGLNQQGQVFYIKCPQGQEAQPSAWSTPVPIFFDVTRISTYINQKTGGITIFANTKQGELALISQDPLSTLWQKSYILLTTPDYNTMVDGYAYSTHVVVNDTNGFPMANAKVSITALTNCIALVNNDYHVLSPNAPVEVMTDATGNISVVQETDNISAVCYTLTPEGVAPLAVNPMTKSLNEKFGPIKTTDALMNATIPDSGGKRLVDPGLSIDKQNATVNALTQLVNTSANFPTNGSIVKPVAARAAATPFVPAPDTIWGVVYGQDTWEYHEGDSAHTQLTSRIANSAKAARGTNAVPGQPETSSSILGDIWNWIDEEFNEVVSFFVKKVNGVYNFFVELGNEIYEAALTCIADIMQGIEFVFDKIAVGFEDLVGFVGHVFGWDDILRTHKVLKNVCIQYTHKIVADIGGYKQTVKDQFTALIQAIDGWAGIVDNIPANLQGQTTSGLRNSQQGIPGSGSPAVNYRIYQIKGNVSAAIMPDQSLTGTTPSDLLDVFMQVLENEKDIFGSFIDSFQTEIIDQFPNLTIGDILKKLGALLADVVVETVENVLLALLDLLQVLAQNIVQLLTAPIEIPVLSPLYKHISGGEDLSILDLVCLVSAIPATLGAKLISGNAPFPDNSTTNALIKAQSFEDIRKAVHGAHQAPVLAGTASLAATDSGHTPNQQLVLAGGILSVFGAAGVSIFGPLKRKADFGGNPVAVLDYLNAFSYLPYVFTDITGQIPDLQQTKWWAVWNEVMADVTTAMVFTDLFVARYSGINEGFKTGWQEGAYPVTVSLLNTLWLLPTFAAILDEENKNLAGELNVIGGVFFDFSGMLTWPIASIKNPEEWLGAYVFNGGLNLVYCGTNLASAIIAYES